MQLQSDNLGEQVISTQTETSISALDPTLEDDKQMTMEETTVKVQGKYIYFILSISLVYRLKIMDIFNTLFLFELQIFIPCKKSSDGGGQNSVIGHNVLIHAGSMGIKQGRGSA